MESEFVFGEYDEKLQSGLKEYYKLWDKGLKKQANKILRETMQYFDTLDSETQKNFAYFYCATIIDKEEYDTLFSRMFHHIGIPYEISIRLCKIIKVDFENNKMPQMKWYYILFDSDIEVIRKAYHHAQCDHETIQWYFSALLKILDWGAHHFPDGCLIEKEVYNKTAEQCKVLMKKHIIDQDLLLDFQYYYNLYEMWWSYLDTDRSEPFADWCKGNEIAFHPVATFYYEK